VVAQQLAKRANGEGRVAALEILLSNYAVSNMIRENKSFQIDSYLQSGEATQAGMISLDACLKGLIRERIITIEEALTFAHHPDSIKELALELDRSEV
jgi:twitching motility protein PilT